jgi:hypothetical protein
MDNNNNKRQKNRIVSPVGVALWPRLDTPDTQFDPDGVYTVKLLIPEEEAKPFLDKLEKIYEANYKAQCQTHKRKKLKLADKPWSAEENDEGELTGNIQFNFKLKAHVKTETAEFEQRPVCFDARGSIIDPTKVRISGGSQIKVCTETSGFYTGLVGAGLSLRLRAVQVIKLEEWQGPDAGAFGFDAEEGYEYEEPEGSDDEAEKDDSGDGFETETETETDDLIFAGGKSEGDNNGDF